MIVSMSSSAAVVLRMLPDADATHLLDALANRPVSEAEPLHAGTCRLEVPISQGAASCIFRDAGSTRVVVSLRLARPP